jgi:hypothetical protein
MLLAMAEIIFGNLAARRKNKKLLSKDIKSET